MARGNAVFVAAAFAGALFASAAARAQDKAVDIPTRPNVTVRSIALAAEGSPRGTIVLLAGGSGMLDIDRNGTPTADARLNQLVRTRADYAKAGYAVLVPDLALDLRRLASPRESNQHAADLGAILAHAKTLAEPVYLVATSNGAVSPAAARSRRVQGAVAQRAQGRVADPARRRAGRHARAVQRPQLPRLLGHRRRGGGGGHCLAAGAALAARPNPASRSGTRPRSARAAASPCGRRRRGGSRRHCTPAPWR